MKITIYELIGLIKDGKAPKKIKVDDYISYLIENETNWVLTYIDDSNDYLFRDYFLRLDDEVEIIEDKKIEKIPYHYNLGYIDCGDLKREVVEELSENFNYFKDKINELIEEIEKLKGKSE